MNIPIYIISYNNFRYVKYMIYQLLNHNNIDIEQLTVIDSCSTDEDTKIFLEDCKVKVIKLEKNYGPFYFLQKEFYDSLPQHFVITDPDLELNENLPHDFLNIMLNLTEKYKIFKVGFQNDLEPDLFLDKKMKNGLTLYQWVSKGFKKKFHDNEFNVDLYRRPIDTVFALYNKKFDSDKSQTNAIRIGNNFSCKHIPWYKNNWIYSMDEYPNLYNNAKFSSIKFYGII